MTHPLLGPLLGRARTALLAPVLAALAGCTGIQEAPIPLNLIIADQAGQELKIVRVSEEQPITTPVTVDGAVRGLVTVNAGRQVAALIGPDDRDYATRIQLFSGGLDPISTFEVDLTRPGLADFQPCYREIAADNRGARVAVYSTCGPGLPQYVLLFDEDGTFVNGADVTNFAEVSYLEQGDRIMLGVIANTVVLALTDNLGSRLVRIPDVGLPVGFVDPLPVVRDVTTVSDVVYVVTVDNTGTPVRPIVNDQFGTALLGLPDGFGDVQRAWGSQRLLALYNPDLGRLTVSDLVNSTAALFVTNLVDVTITPDGFLYALQDPITSASASTLTRYDVGRIAPDFDTRRASIPVEGGLTDARFITWVLPADVTVSPGFE